MGMSLLIFVAVEMCVNPWQHFDQHIHCSGNVITELLLGNGHPLWLSSVMPQYCLLFIMIIIKIKV
jgi:hypothetical protein